MKISLIHPSRSRPKEALTTSAAWLSRAYNSLYIEYILSLDTSDPRLNDYHDALRKQSIVNDNRSAIQAINKAAEKATGDLLIVISDDFSCEQDWDVKLLDALHGKEDFIVKTPDGYQKTLITLPIMDRKYYERFGYIYHPDYKHLWCDTEMTVVGHMLGRVIDVDVLFEHMHHSLGKSKKDKISEKNDATWQQGKRVFHERLKSNFGVENPLCKFEDIKW